MTEYERLKGELERLVVEGRRKVIELRRQGKGAEAERLHLTVRTELEPASTFYPAEDYHQQYLAKRGLDTCHI